MSLRLIASLLLAVGLSFSAGAQSDSTILRAHPSISVYSGVLFAKPGDGSAMSATVRPGIRVNRLILTVGAGYDRYLFWRTLPVFAGAGYDLIRGTNAALFIQLDAGYSEAWMNPAGNPGVPRIKGGGFFFHPLMGCLITQGKLAIYFSAGYKDQRLTFRENFQLSSRRTLDADIRRFSFQMGLGL